MKVGIKLFALKKLIQHKRIIKKFPESYLLYSDNEDLEDKISNQFNKNCVIINSIEGLKMLIEMSSDSSIEILFDSNFTTFKTMIQIMEEFKDKKCTFKILSTENNFLIGSNNCNDKGDVIILSKNT